MPSGILPPTVLLESCIALTAWRFAQTDWGIWAVALVALPGNGVIKGFH